MKKNLGSRGGLAAGIIGRSETTSGKDAVCSNPRSGEGAWTAKMQCKEMQRGQSSIRKVPAHTLWILLISLLSPSLLTGSALSLPSATLKPNPLLINAQSVLCFPSLPSRSSSPHTKYTHTHSKSLHNSPPVHFSPTSATRAWFPC